MIHTTQDLQQLFWSLEFLFVNCDFNEHKQVLPSVSTFYNQIEGIYEKTITKIRNSIGEHPIYFTVDETTDARKRFVLNILVGKLDGTVSAPTLLCTIFLGRKPQIARKILKEKRTN